MRAIITRDAVFNGYGRCFPYSWNYRTTVNDDQWQNSSIVTLRRLLKFRYGKSIEIVENYDKSITLRDYLPGGRMA